MYSTSSKYKEKIYSNSREMYLKVKLYTKSGREFIFSPDRRSDLLSMKYKSNSSSNEKLEIGYASGCSFDMQLSNLSKDWTAIKDFEGGKIEPEIGIRTDEDTIEYVPLGIFDIETVDKKNGIISLNSMDAMVQFDVKLDGIDEDNNKIKHDNNKIKHDNIEYMFPITIKQLINICCSQVGIQFVTDSFLNDDFIISNVKKLENVSLRNIIKQCAQLACGFAKININGEMEICSYDIDTVNDSLTCSEMFEHNAKEKLEITGINFMAGQNSFQQGDNSGYMIELKNNLIADEDAALVSTAVIKVWNRLSAFKYVPCSLKAQGNPALQIGDVINVTGRDDNEGKALITSFEFNSDMSMNITSAGAALNKQGYTGDFKTDYQSQIDNFDNGIPDQKGMAGAVLKTDGTQMYWSLAENTIIDISPVDGVLKLDATLEGAIYRAKDVGTIVGIQVINTEALSDNAVKDIVVVFGEDTSSKTVTWGSNIRASNTNIKNTEANKINEYILRCYKSVASTWLLTRQVF